MKFEDLKLAYGYPLQLQTNSNGHPERFSCRIIGCLPGRGILLSVPRAAGKYVRFRPGQKMVARLMVDNGVGIFACALETQIAEPLPMLLVTYPDNVNFKGIRGATRVEVVLPIEASNPNISGGVRVEGIIADISASGARLELVETIGENGDKVTIYGVVDVLGISRNLQVDAVIRSRVERSTQEGDANLPAIYGVEFVEKDEDRCLLLYAYVFSQIAKDEQLG